MKLSKLGEKTMTFDLSTFKKLLFFFLVKMGDEGISNWIPPLRRQDVAAISLLSRPTTSKGHHAQTKIDKAPKTSRITLISFISAGTPAMLKSEVNDTNTKIAATLVCNEKR